MATHLLALAALAVCLALLPSGASAAACADHASQADAQRAADTRDADGDGIYCESLPCPCAGEGAPGGADPPAKPAQPSGTEISGGCWRPTGVQRIGFERAKYPNIRRHFVSAVGKGWPRILVINRTGTDQRRARLLTQTPTSAGFDRDEYPPAVGRGRGRGLTRGTKPLGWRADVRYVPSGENRSHGSSLGGQLRRFCNGTRFRYVFR